MSQTYISCKTAKALKAFLGDSAPEPMIDCWYSKTGEKVFWKSDGVCPTYQLHDLLSKPFCEAMAKAGASELSGWKVKNGIGEKVKRYKIDYSNVREKIFSAYCDYGIPAVEKALMEMMEDK